MLAYSAHARLLEAPDQCARKLRDRLRVGVKRTVADNAAGAIIDVQHRRERQIDAVCSQLRGQNVARVDRKLASTAGMDIPCSAQCPHWRNRREALAKPLYPPPFVVDSDQKGWIAQGMHTRGETGKLLGRG